MADDTQSARAQRAGEATEPAAAESAPGSPPIQSVFVTGATGFVGRHVVRDLLRRGLHPVCLVRDADRLYRSQRPEDAERITAITGSLSDTGALREGTDISQAAIHLVGIILESRLRGQTYDRVHRVGTERVVDQVRSSGIRRYLHMSALGTRPDAVAVYHQTKFAAEQYVRESGLDWTIFRPSLIHGPEGEFMRLMKLFMCGLLPPVVPYFGDGRAKLQPVSVRDVAYCFVEALFRPQTIGQTYPLGGPKVYTWKEFYNACRTLMPRAKRWKPMVSQPVPVAMMMARLTCVPMAMAGAVIPRLKLLRFNTDQVRMSQEDNVCDHRIAGEAFDIRPRSFEDELSSYADRIP
jgi:NADH dehydrogenase